MGHVIITRGVSYTWVSSVMAFVRATMFVSRPLTRRLWCSRICCSRTRGKPLSLQRQITLAQRKKNVTESMKLFEELLSSGERPEETVLSAMLHLCRTSNESEEATEVLKAIDKFAPNPGVSLLTSKLNYYLSIGDQKELWQIYEQCHNHCINLRENISFKLLDEAVHTKHHIHAMDILNHVKMRNFPMNEPISQSVLKLAAEEESESPWQPVAMRVMEIYQASLQVVSPETGDEIVKWLTSRWRSPSVYNTTVKSNCCNHCGMEMEANTLTESEHTHLLEHAKASLKREAYSFEDSQREEDEYKLLMNECCHNRPFGAILDGLNITITENNNYTHNIGKLMSMCNWMLQYTKKPVLVIARSHLARHFTEFNSIAAIKEFYKRQNIHLFFTRNRVADDYYTVYSSLVSGPLTLLVSNDKMGDHVAKVEPSLQDAYKKWLRSCQVKFDKISKNVSSQSIELPKRHDTKVQWTQDHFHVPLDNSTWMCIKNLTT